MSPKRHAGPRTVLSFHSPTNVGEVGDRRVEHVDRRPARRSARRATRRGCRAPGRSSPTGTRRPSRRRRASALSRSATARVAAASSPSRATIGRPARRLGVERRAAHDAQHGGHAARPSARRRTRPATGPAGGGRRSTRAVLAIASARSAARPTQNSASAARVGTDEPRSTCGSGGRHDHRRGAGRAEHPHVLGQPGRRPPGVVAGGEHPPVAAGHHRHAVGSGDGVQADDDVGG